MSIGKMAIGVVVGAVLSAVISQIPLVSCIPCLLPLLGGFVGAGVYGLLKRPDGVEMTDGLIVGGLTGFVSELITAVISIVLFGVIGVSTLLLGLPLLLEQELRLLFAGLVAYEVVIGVVAVIGIVIAFVVNIVVGAVGGVIAATLLGGGKTKPPAASS